jgi:DNA-binding GntR family transcriptional regulator
VRASRQLEIRSVVDDVHEALLERIVAGELPPGTRLRQEALADELGVSRTPLREALVRLASEGLVEFAPNRGATVASRDFSDMQQAWRARLLIEPGAARLAAERREPDSIERLRVTVQRQRLVAEDVTASFALNREFHLTLVRASGNAHLAQFADLLWLTRIGVPIFAQQARDRGRILAWADEHEAIAEAVAAGRPALAERLTRDHIAAYPPPAATPARA